jgi:hypothetical protein
MCDLRILSEIVKMCVFDGFTGFGLGGPFFVKFEKFREFFVKFCKSLLNFSEKL